MPKKILTTTLNTDLVKKLKFLGVEVERPINSLLEEAIKDLLEKYKSGAHTTDTG